MLLPAPSFLLKGEKESKQAVDLPQLQPALG